MSDGKRNLPDWTEIDWDSVDLEELIDIPSEEEIAACHSFSPEFEANMEKMFREAGIELNKGEETAGSEEIRKLGSTELLEDVGEFGVFGVPRVEDGKEEDAGKGKRSRAGRRRSHGFRLTLATACLLAVVSVGMVTLIQSEAVPHIVIEIFQEWYDDFVKITWGSNQKEAMKFEVREPENLPEGYELVEKEEKTNYYGLIYENELGEKIEIQGRRLVSGSLGAEDSTNVQIESWEKNGIICRISEEQDGTYMGEWVQKDVVYRVFAPIDKEELKRIIEQLIGE